MAMGKRRPHAKPTSMWVGLVKGKTVGIDATMLEANAALRSIVRRDTGESYHDFFDEARAGVWRRDADARTDPVFASQTRHHLLLKRS
jgi:hypothetical protein